jgi:hypothetical protein
MFTLARDLYLITSRILAELTAILLAGRNFTRAWDVGALGLRSIFHYQFLPQSSARLGNRQNSFASPECMRVSKCGDL